MKKLKTVKVAEPVLTPEQEADAQRWAEIMAAKLKEETLALARMLAAKKTEELLGQTEVEVRDRVHRIRAYALETALNERKKGGTSVRA